MQMREASRDPVVIIGAARSGTNMLRNVLVGLPGYSTWPCDEINYIWRHGNRSWPDDEFEPEHARPEVIRYIRKSFDRFSSTSGASVVVEKTCANSLRVDFVARVLPEARYVFIVRDGRDAVASAQKRWTAPLDVPYLLAKARYVPASDLPYYGFRYLRNRVHRLFSRERRLAFWGPQFRGIQDALRECTVYEVAAMQWARSVERSSEALSRIDPERVHRLRYEDFVTEPEREVSRLADFLNQPLSRSEARVLAGPVSAQSVGKWREELDRDVIRAVEPHLAPMLFAHGYA